MDRRCFVRNTTTLSTFTLIIPKSVLQGYHEDGQVEKWRAMMSISCRKGRKITKQILGNADLIQVLMGTAIYYPAHVISYIAGIQLNNKTKNNPNE